MIFRNGKLVLMLFLFVVFTLVGCEQSHTGKTNNLNNNQTGDSKIVGDSKNTLPDEKTTLSKNNKETMEKFFAEEKECDKYNDIYYGYKIGILDGKIIYKNGAGRTGTLNFDTKKIKKVIDNGCIITNTGVYHLTSMADSGLELKIINGADPDTFKVLNSTFAKDKDNLFSLGNIAGESGFIHNSIVDIKNEDIDLESLESIKIPIKGTNCIQKDVMFLMDKNYIYKMYMKDKIVKIDNSFKILPKNEEDFGIYRDDIFYEIKGKYYLYSYYWPENGNYPKAGINVRLK